jgi:hypothetical protein
VTFDRAHYYVSFGGPTYGGLEEWQTGLKFAPWGGAPSTDPGPLLGGLEHISVADILTRATAFISASPNVHWGNAVAISWAKVAVLGVDGKYAGDPILAEQLPVSGGFVATGYPPQLAAVVSAWSGTNLGRANHGRSYLPVPHSWMTTTTVLEPRVSAAAADGLRDDYLAMVRDIEGEVDTIEANTAWVIMSKLAAGTTKIVEQVGCGRVIDTMRSRRARLDDEQSYVGYTPTAIAASESGTSWRPTLRRK